MVSRFYRTHPEDTGDMEAPRVLRYWRGLRPGLRVRYTGPHPLPGAHVITEIIDFNGDGMVVVVLDDGDYEVAATNLVPCDVLSCGHVQYGDSGYCAVMTCSNYVARRWADPDRR